jgi:molybdate transport system substrate-binding protein
MGMKRTRGKISAFLICAVITFLPLSSNAGEIRVSLAASLKDAVTELSEAFAKTHPGVTFQKNSGASGALVKQIENGAPADIFISANIEWMNYLKDRGFISEKDVSILAYNSLVFVGKSGLNLKTIKEIVLLEKIAIGSPKSVPAGEYAMEAIKKAGIDSALNNKLVMTRDVLECLMYVERDEVDGAFIYTSNTLEMSDRVKILFQVPQDLYSRVIYPMALTNTGAKNKDAKAFFEFLQSEKARAVLSRYGFIIE